MKRILKILCFLRITEDGVLSLTNIALGIVLYRICTTKTLDLGHGIAMLTALASYQGKRAINNYFDPYNRGSSGVVVDNPDKM
jgi:hypothetical protein